MFWCFDISATVLTYIQSHIRFILGVSINETEGNDYAKAPRPKGQFLLPTVTLQRSLRFLHCTEP